MATDSGLSSPYMVLLARLLPVVFALGSPIARAMTPTEVFHATSRNVAVLEVLDSQGGATTNVSSAVIVGNAKAIVQCSLLVADGTTMRLLHGGRSYATRMGSQDLKRNLCVLHIDDLEVNVLTMQSVESLPVGSRVFAVGNTLGLGISISEGVVAALRDISGERLIQFTAPIAPGSEGGGLFDDHGRLVGIIRYLRLGGQNVNFAIPAAAISEIEARASQQVDFGVWYGKASELWRTKNFDGLAEVSRTRIAIAPSEPQPWIFLGVADFGRNAFESAELAFREAIARDRDTLLPHIYLVQSMIAAKRYQVAADAARASLQQFPDDPTLTYFIAVSEFYLGKNDTARSRLEDLVRQNPGNVTALNMLADMDWGRGDTRGVVRAVRQLAQINSQDIWAWVRLSEAYLRDGKPQRALLAAQRALELQPESADAWLWMGRSLGGLGRYKESIQALQKALERKLKFPAWAWGSLAYIYYELGLYPEAIAAYREVVRLEPDNTQAVSQLGVALKDDGELDEAMALFEKFRTERPKDPFGWRQIGFVQMMRGKPELAIPALERSLELDPKQAKVWHALLQSYNNAGRYDDVRRAYNKLTELDKSRADLVFRQYIVPSEMMR